MTDAVLAAAAVFLAIVWWVFASKRKQSRQSPPPPGAIMDGAAVASEPLLTESELALLNVLQIAVQDHYLIFAQVPLCSFVSLESAGKSRVQLLKHMAVKRVDFVLMHPGSRRVEHVVQIEEESPTSEVEERQRIIESIVVGAGIKLVKVRSKRPYTIPELASLLGLGVEE